MTFSFEGVVIDDPKLFAEQLSSVADSLSASSKLIVVSNRTNDTAYFIDAYDDSDLWPLLNVPSGGFGIALMSGSFSFAARYKIGDLFNGPVVVFAASNPLVGYRKIDLQLRADRSAQQIWDELNDDLCKVRQVSAGLGECRAQIFDERFWVFDIVKWW